AVKLRLLPRRFTPGVEIGVQIDAEKVRIVEPRPEQRRLRFMPSHPESVPVEGTAGAREPDVQLERRLLPEPEQRRQVRYHEQWLRRRARRRPDRHRTDERRRVRPVLLIETRPLDSTRITGD